MGDTPRAEDQQMYRPRANTQDRVSLRLRDEAQMSDDQDYYKSGDSEENLMVQKIQEQIMKAYDKPVVNMVQTTPEHLTAQIVYETDMENQKAVTNPKAIIQCI